PVDLQAGSNDPTLKAKVTGNTVRLSGNASNTGITPSFLTVYVDGKGCSVQLSKGMTPAEALKELSSKLPLGYELKHVSGGKKGESAAQIVRKAEPPAEKVPAISVRLANDPTQHVQFTGGAKLTIAGTASNNGMIPSFVNLELDGKSISVSVSARDSAAKTAQKIQSALPAGFAATIESRPGKDEAVVTITKK
ncbi:MAG: hypothetical protein ACJ790_01230, partial [Myxococcaceae bacterium]